MSQRNTDFLFRNFDFFGSRSNPKDPLMCFGFECGDGWFSILKKLCGELKALKLKNFTVIQVKEKYGTLRFYHNGPSGSEKLQDKVYKLIDDATAKSARTCEMCGKQGQRGEALNWVCTCCKKHQPDGFKPYKKTKSQKAL